MDKVPRLQIKWRQVTVGFLNEILFFRQVTMCILFWSIFNIDYVKTSNRTRQWFKTKISKVNYLIFQIFLLQRVSDLDDIIMVLKSVFLYWIFHIETAFSVRRVYPSVTNNIWFSHLLINAFSEKKISYEILSWRPVRPENS